MEQFASEDMAREVEKFFSVNRFPGYEKVIKQAIQIIRINAAWLKRDADTLRDYLVIHNQNFNKAQNNKRKRSLVRGTDT